MSEYIEKPKKAFNVSLYAEGHTRDEMIEHLEELIGKLSDLHENETIKTQNGKLKLSLRAITKNEWYKELREFLAKVEEKNKLKKDYEDNIR